ncbi:MAG: c-type cytochrome [Verrucomicrobia bacterium]|nr:c-type cytochrome [Verrucomicrobiota bacterium]
MTFLRPFFSVLLVGVFLLPFLSAADNTKSLSDTQRLQIALEALNRIESDPATNAILQKAISNVLSQVRGTPEFVRIVKKFNLKGQTTGLLEVAQKDPAGESGVEAMRLILANGEMDVLRSAVAESDTVIAARLVEALGNAKDQRGVPLLLPLVNQTGRDVIVRKMAVRALAQTQEGAGELLKIVRKDNLPGDLRLVTSEALNGARWPKIKTEAEQLLPLPKSRNAQPLPPLSELALMKGNPGNGEKLYFSEGVACASCHQVGGRGTEIGPNLSEIGTKLAREALYESILDPNAGISFGYEAHQFELASGDEAYGLLASETEDEIAVKDLQGIVTTFRKSEVAARKQLSTSIMPAGLAEGLSPQELVDLVEFLAGLKKP